MTVLFIYHCLTNLVVRFVRVSQVLIIISMAVTLVIADEKQLDKDAVEAASGRGCISAFGDLFRSLRNLPPNMYKVLAVTAVTWVRPVQKNN